MGRVAKGCVQPWLHGNVAVFLMLASVARADALRSAQPDGVGDAEWATLLVTAFLRKRLGSEKGVWAAMESKAVTWLGSRWKPAEGSSLGAATIAAMKLL